MKKTIQKKSAQHVSVPNSARSDVVVLPGPVDFAKDSHVMAEVVLEAIMDKCDAKFLDQYVYEMSKPHSANIIIEKEKLLVIVSIPFAHLISTLILITIRGNVTVIGRRKMSHLAYQARSPCQSVHYLKPETAMRTCSSPTTGTFENLKTRQAAARDQVRS